MFSLDRLLPAVALVDDEVPDGALTPAQQHWFGVQRVLGWILALFIVSWLGSLLGAP